MYSNNRNKEQAMNYGRMKNKEAKQNRQSKNSHQIELDQSENESVKSICFHL
jgi:hypothetical protein